MTKSVATGNGVSFFLTCEPCETCEMRTFGSIVLYEILPLTFVGQSQGRAVFLQIDKTWMLRKIRELQKNVGEFFGKFWEMNPDVGQSLLKFWEMNPDVGQSLLKFWEMNPDVGQSLLKFWEMNPDVGQNFPKFWLQNPKFWLQNPKFGQ
jgi:hypothetical protein